MSLNIAVPKERRPSERRVALVPGFVERLVALGADLSIEAGCARFAGYHDAAWESAGRSATSSEAVRAAAARRGGTVREPVLQIVEGFSATVARADIVLKVAPPTLDEVAELPRGCLLVSLMSAFQHLDVVEALRQRSVTVLAMDLVPRLTRARSMNALASQATVAGYKAGLLAAELSPRMFPMLTTAAGTVRPGRVVVIGAGVAGLQAIATVRRLGARVEAYDIRGAARERIESVGASVIDTGVVAEGSDGLARALRSDERQRQHDVLGEHIARADAVICAASIPGRAAPHIISADMVERMLPDTVIVDMAASTGGNCVLTRPGEQFRHHDVLVSGPLNLPSHGAVDASDMYARNVVNLLELVIREGALRFDPGDEIIARTMLISSGQLHHLPTAGLLGLPAVAFGEIEQGLAFEAREAADETADWLPEADIETVRAAKVTAVEEGASNLIPALAGQEGPAAVAGAAAPQTADARRSADWRGAPRAPVKSDGVPGEGVPSEEVPGEAAPADTDVVAGSGERLLPPAAPMRSTAPTAKDVGVQPTLEVDTNDLGKVDGASGDRPGSEPGDTPGSEPGDELHDSSGGEAGVRVGDSSDAHDDLTAIDGVGPALQTRLRDCGFTRYEQIADLDEAGLERLSVQLELDDEVSCADWAAQARRLAERA